MLHEEFDSLCGAFKDFNLLVQLLVLYVDFLNRGAHFNLVHLSGGFHHLHQRWRPRFLCLNQFFTTIAARSDQLPDLWYDAVEGFKLAVSAHGKTGLEAGGFLAELFAILEVLFS